MSISMYIDDIGDLKANQLFAHGRNATMLLRSKTLKPRVQSYTLIISKPTWLVPAWGVLNHTE